ncbi:unnamed protein product [Brassica oleracea var. botrytis]
MRSLILEGGEILLYKKGPDAAPPPFKCGCSVIGRLGMSDAVGNS